MLSNDDHVRPAGHVLIDYTNWRGERAVREIVPVSVKFGANEWHPKEQWMMLAHDVEKDALRWFAMSGIHSWKNKQGETEMAAGGYEAADSPIKDWMPADLQVKLRSRINSLTSACHEALDFLSSRFENQVSGAWSDDEAKELADVLAAVINDFDTRNG